MQTLCLAVSKDFAWVLRKHFLQIWFQWLLAKWFYNLLDFTNKVKLNLMFQIKLNDFVHETGCDKSVWNLFDHVVKKKKEKQKQNKKTLKIFSTLLYRGWFGKTSSLRSCSILKTISRHLHFLTYTYNFQPTLLATLFSLFIITIKHFIYSSFQPSRINYYKRTTFIQKVIGRHL